MLFYMFLMFIFMFAAYNSVFYSQAEFWQFSERHRVVLASMLRQTPALGTDLGAAYYR